MEVNYLNSLVLLSCFLFFAGVYGFLTRRNMIALLMSVELILNAATINFIAFNKYLYPGRFDGLFFTLFIITVAAAEAALAIAIIIHVYRQIKSVDIQDVDQLS